MDYVDANKLKIAKYMEEARSGQEEWKSMRGNQAIGAASKKFGFVMQEIARKGNRRKGVIDMPQEQLDRIIHRITR